MTVYGPKYRHIGISIRHPLWASNRKNRSKFGDRIGRPYKTGFYLEPTVYGPETETMDRNRTIGCGARMKRHFVSLAGSMLDFGSIVLGGPKTPINTGVLRHSIQRFVRGSVAIAPKRTAGSKTRP